MKEKIKQKAIRLFNERGISTVSMLKIADSLSISAGNLSYHYKTKKTLINSIYNDLHNESLDFITPKENVYITLHHFETTMLKFNKIQKKYTFFFNELVHIARVYPEVIKKYETKNIDRFKEVRKLIDYYIATNRIIKEGNYVDYDKLIYTIWMTSTFWLSQNQVITNDKLAINKFNYLTMLWHLLLPYLTEKGMEEYVQIKQFVKN